MKGNDLAYLVIIILFSPLVFEVVRIFKFLKKNEYDKKKLKKYLTRTSVLLFTFLIFIIILNRINFLNYKKPIPFSKINEITLDDFVGLEFFHRTFNGSEKYAYIVTSIDYEKRKDSVRVTSLFHPSESYVFNKHSKSKELLQHELYHFMITEVFTRKIRKAISEENTISDKKIESIINKHKIEENSYQERYDYDTHHSYVYKEQKKYEIEIDSLINSLSNFAHDKIYVYEAQ